MGLDPPRGVKGISLTIRYGLLPGGSFDGLITRLLLALTPLCYMAKLAPLHFHASG